MATPFPRQLVLEPTSRRPTVLDADTVDRVLSAPIPPRRGLTPFVVPRVSIVVVTHDNLVFTRLCLESLLASTGAPTFEVVVVDNGSTDGTVDYLGRLASADARVEVISSKANLGFAAGTNLGFKAARGERLVALNNDTIVAAGWLAGLVRHLEDRTVGMVGPVTNQAPDESRVMVDYTTYGGFLEAAAARASVDRARDVAGLTLFCVALRRDVLDRVGLLDERFQVGMFEDDDYCLRLEAAGLRLRVAEDVLVHHFGEASLGKLAADGRWMRIFEANRRRFEEKWGRPWGGHKPADEALYLELLERVRNTLDASLPASARVVVASRGDERLCAIPGRVAGHFPQLPDGRFAGSYPAGDEDAIQQVDLLSRAGWTHLVIPSTARWWLDHYPDWRDHLSANGGLLTDDPESCVVFRLPAPAEPTR
ncbi:MAG TPA: glycosyltransferase family 2 protein [Candidatus Solibacter sp.]|nr:glycosyltransferase family 2 protein [Candidatus Solibacter sp.]